MKREWVDPDNPDQELIHLCMQKKQRILNPIIDWEDSDVWEFVHKYHVPYCKLYDQGYKRLGCIGCPMSVNRAKELERYPKVRAAYIRAFDRMLITKKERGNLEEDATWTDGEAVMKWYLSK